MFEMMRFRRKGRLIEVAPGRWRQASKNDSGRYALTDDPTEYSDQDVRVNAAEPKRDVISVSEVPRVVADPVALTLPSREGRNRGAGGGEWALRGPIGGITGHPWAGAIERPGRHGQGGAGGIAGQAGGATGASGVAGGDGA